MTTKFWAVTVWSSSTRRDTVGPKIAERVGAFTWHYGVHGPSLRLSINGTRMNPGQVGCYLAHYTLWQRIAAECSEDVHVVFEDDVAIRPDFLDYYADVIAALPKKWDVVRLGYQPVASVKNDLVSKYGKVSLYTGACSETHCYCVRASLIREQPGILDGPQVVPFDNKLDCLHAQNRIQQLIVDTPLAWQEWWVHKSLINADAYAPAQ